MEGLAAAESGDADCFCHNSPEAGLLCGPCVTGPWTDSLALIENHILYKGPRCHTIEAAHPEDGTREGQAGAKTGLPDHVGWQGAGPRF